MSRSRSSRFVSAGIILATLFSILTAQGSYQTSVRQHKYKRNANNSDNLSNGRGIEETKSTTLYIMAMAPYPDTSGMPVNWDGGPGLIPAARLAVEHINKRLPQNYQLALIEIDSGCLQYKKVLPGYTENLYHTRKNIVGIVGPACSHVAMFLGKLSTPSRAPIVTVTIGTSRRLQNRTQYPYIFTAVSSVDIYVRILVRLAAQYKWKKIGVIFSAYSKYFKDILDLLRKNVSTFEMVSFPMYDSASPIADILESEVRILVILTPPRMAEILMCDAYQHVPSLTYPVYQWLFVERSHVTFGNDAISCSKQELIEAFDNSILFTYTFETLDRTNPIVSGLLFDDLQSEYHEKVKQHEQETGLNITADMPYSLVYAPVYYDAVWALGLAVQSVIESGDIDLKSYRPPNGNESLHLAEMLKEHIYNQSFKGASGTIKFDRTTGQGNSIIEFLQVRNGSTDIVGYYCFDNSTYGSNMLCYNCTFINDSYEELVIGIPLSIGSTGLGITILLFIVAVVFHILNTFYASHKTIKASSPYLNHLIFIGYYIMAVGNITYVLTHMNIFSSSDVETSLCITYQWEVSIGLNLILATLCMKTWRIYRIFIHYRNPGGKLLTNPILIMFALLLLVPIVIVLICVTALNHITWDTKTTLTKSLKNLPVFEKTGSCVFPVWFIVADKLCGGVLLVCTLFLAILSRHINKRYRTIKSISALIYTQTVITGLGLPVVYITKDHFVQSDLYHIMLCVYLDGLLFVYLVFLFMPPIIPLFAEKWTCCMSNKNSNRRGSELTALTAALRRASNVSLLFITVQNSKPDN